MKKKQRKWVKFRHKVVRALLWPYFDITSRLIYGARIEKYKGHKGEPVIILFNHVTGYDQFFVSLAFKQPVYYVAMDDLFNKGFLSKLLIYLVAPIPFKKQSTDLKALKSILQIVREGGTVSLSPEGNRTYSGRTCEMKPSIASLCKKLKIPIVLYRIDGGYGVQPRWSDKTRRGRINCGVTRVLEPSEYEHWSEDDLFDVIRDELELDEARDTAVFRSKRTAEYLERAMYVCPKCGLTTFESNRERIKCLKCDRKIKYLENTRLEGVGFHFPYKYVADWYAYQNLYINRLDTLKLTDEPLYREKVRIYDVIPGQRKTLMDDNATIELYGDRVRVLSIDTEPMELFFKEMLGAACVGNNRLNLETKDKVYLVKGDKRFNPVKYVNLYYRYSNLTKGDGNGKFLGL